MLFDKFINSVAMAKTTFFSKTLKMQARFSPRRDVFVVTLRMVIEKCTMILASAYFKILQSSWILSIN